MVVNKDVFLKTLEFTDKKKSIASDLFSLVEYK